MTGGWSPVSAWRVAELRGGEVAPDSTCQDPLTRSSIRPTGRILPQAGRASGGDARSLWEAGLPHWAQPRLLAPAPFPAAPAPVLEGPLH